MATQTLTFVKVGEEYVAAFETTADFALHLERPEAGSLTLGVSSVKDGDFARVENLSSRVRYQTVFDYDFLGGIYPKYIRVASETEPTMAVVTSEGEITPIKIKGDIPDPGVYIQHINGEYFTSEEWTAGGYSNDLANGVLVASKECTFVMAKEDVGSRKQWSSDTNNAVDGILTTGKLAVAETDYLGEANTALMLATDTKGAGYLCANYVFPNGKKGYLPALGEWNVAYANKSDINSLMTLIGDTSLGSNFYWSSTQFSAASAWVMGWGSGPTGGNLKENIGHVRAFTTL